MKQVKIQKTEVSNELKYSIFGLPLRITPEIRDTTFNLFKTNPDKYAAIKKSIAAANGKLDEPIKIYKLGSETGDYFTIVDGHTRFQILEELDKLPLDEFNVSVVKDLFCVADAIQMAYRLNDMRRQAEIYQQAANAINANPMLSDREVAEISGLSTMVIHQVRYIKSVFQNTENKTDAEKNEIQKLKDDVESGEKTTRPVYEIVNGAEKTNDFIDAEEDEKIAEDARKHFETLKYTKVTCKIDKNNNPSGMVVDYIKGLKVKKESTPYDDDVYPVMIKLCKLQEKYSAINTVTTAGHQDALTNAEGAIRAFLMNNINENKTDVMEGVRSILLEALNEKRDTDITSIMKKVKDLLQVSKNDYFIAAMQVPNNPEGVMNE